MAAWIHGPRARRQACPGRSVPSLPVCFLLVPVPLNRGSAGPRPPVPIHSPSRRRTHGGRGSGACRDRHRPSRVLYRDVCNLDLRPRCTLCEPPRVFSRATRVPWAPRLVGEGRGPNGVQLNGGNEHPMCVCVGQSVSRTTSELSEHRPRHTHTRMHARTHHTAQVG